MRYKDLNAEWYTNVAAAIQNAIQCYRVVYDEKKRATAQTSLDRLLKREMELNPARSQNLCLEVRPE